ncbi:MULTISPECIES: hypothetical protein [Thalassolituus]|uniref:hypothetical protein n=2 Tax=Oceanospirillaceae TaxID=135620 RepID=UPI000C5F0721|nr:MULTISPECIES: hypothetical protein [Thalassolituus]MAX87028.1 hypothetical protein [Oceanospirillaceae bacterium]|tara:strand:+ start:1090 stop:1812 length:723 start_codon:yes stop_codon:yes gene_type:complete
MKIQYAIGALVGAAALCSANVSASQYLGVGAEYGELNEQYSGADYPILNFETRFGMDFSDRFSLEVEGAVLGKDDREFEGGCLDQTAVDRITNDVSVGCAYLDSVSRQAVTVNFVLSQPFANFDLFAGLGVGAVRTSYTFTVDSVGVSSTEAFQEFAAADIQQIQNYLDFFLGEGAIDLQLPDDVSETSIDLMYSLEGGILIDDTHRLSVTWNPEYGSEEVGKYEYVGFSYSWLFRFDDF